MRTKTPVIVHLRKRLGNDGKENLYLDIIEYGQRRKESLHMCLIPGKDTATKLKNRETMHIAELKAKSREDELNSYADGYEREATGLDRLFFEYFIDQMEKKKNEHTYYNWRNALLHLQSYEHNKHITFRQITPHWVAGFRDYLTDKAAPITYKEHNQKVEEDENGRLHRVRTYKGERAYLATNTARGYFLCLVCCINAAIEEHIIKRNPCEGIKRIGKEETNREHLTVEEFKKLMDTPCGGAQTKEAFLFACMCGLRHSDLTKLTWRDIKESNGVTYVETQMQKTKKIVRVPLNDVALSIIGERKDASSKVFDKLCSTAHINEAIACWVKRAGIDKDITFHCSRHTFACLTLLASGDLYTTSKLLGHSDIKVTQVYAKVLDDNKVKAINALNNLI